MLLLFLVLPPPQNGPFPGRKLVEIFLAFRCGPRFI